MIEILVLVTICRKLARIAEAKGRSRAWGGLAALGWIAGEIGGFIVGISLALGAVAYAVALGCAALGAVIAYVVVRGLGPGGMVAAYAASTTPVRNENYDPANPFSPPRAE